MKEETRSKLLQLSLALFAALLFTYGIYDLLTNQAGMPYRSLFLPFFLIAAIFIVRRLDKQLAEMEAEQANTPYRSLFHG